MKHKYLALFLITFICFPSILFAWGQKGHRIIAQVAYQHLSKKATKQVDAILGEHGMVYWANWPDEIKSDTIYPTSYDWHFQDLPADLTDEQMLAILTDYPTHGGNLWRTLDSLKTLLHNDPKQHDALVFLIHLTGDSYCPMHTGHEDDLGGNRVKMKWFGSNTNLHRVWDEQLIQSRGYSYTEYAQYLEDTFSQEKSHILQTPHQQAMLENYHLTCAIYDYQEQFDGNTYHYIYRWHTDCERQLYRAGLHLAQLLNSLYK